MFGTIGFENHRISCIIGVEPEERIQEQLIYVDLTVVVDISRPARTDRIEDAVCYAHLAEVCTEVAKKGKYVLIEAYACAVLEDLTARFPLRKASIRVKKPRALATADHAIVSLTMEGKGWDGSS